MFKVRNIEFGGGIPKIAVPVIAESEEEICEVVREAGTAGDLIELRADAFSGIYDTMRLLSLLSDVRELTDRPILFTLRSKREGGLLDVHPEEYLDILRIAISSGSIDLIDIELWALPTEEAEEYGISTAQMLTEESHGFGIRVVMSQHNFVSTPGREDIYEALKKMRDLGADIAKGAYMPETYEDVDEVLAAGLKAEKNLSIPFILISMGEMGQMTRTHGEVFGSAVTFACLRGKASAPGQFEADELAQILTEIHERRKESGMIFLIGFMGAGKSTVGAALSNLCDCDVIEMDEEIEAEQGTPISAIFENKGEKYFRDLETDFIASLSEESGGIVSCGGGAVLRARNVVLMKSLGKVVLLTAEPETVYERLLHEADMRPVLAGRFTVEGIRSLGNARMDFYNEARDFAVATDGKTAADIAGEILELLQWRINRPQT